MGNFSKNPKIVLQEALEKGYSSVRFQQGKPLLDRELNLLADLANPQRLAEHHLGNGVPADSNGFLISGLDVANNDFTIGAGRCLVGGYEIALTVNTTYKTQPHTENVSTLPSGVSNVYLRVFQSKATGAQDADLNNSGVGDVGFETAIREKTEWEVLVTTAVISTSDHFLLAEINTNTATVVDRRRTGLTVASIRDEIALSRGSFSQLSSRLDVSLAIDGTLKTDSVGNLQIANNAVNTNKIADNSVSTNKIVDNAITAAKILDGSVGAAELANSSVTNAKIADNAVTTAKILDGSVSIKKLKTRFYWDATTTIAANGRAGFNTIAVPLTTPRGAVLLIKAYSTTNGARFEWKEESSTSGGWINQVVWFQNLSNIPIEVKFKIYELLEN